MKTSMLFESPPQRHFCSGSQEDQWGDRGLIENIASLRIQLDEEEIQEMRNTAKITAQASYCS